MTKSLATEGRKTPFQQQNQAQGGDILVFISFLLRNTGERLPFKRFVSSAEITSYSAGPPCEPTVCFIKRMTL